MTRERLSTRGPRLHEQFAPRYLRDLADTKKPYLSALVGFSPLLKDVDGKIIIPGVGGSQEPYQLFDTYSERVVSTDINLGVIKRHRLESAPYEHLLVGDIRNLPFVDQSAKLVSLSSVTHEMLSDEVRDALLTGLFSDRSQIVATGLKNEIIRREVAEVKRLIAPGGILAFREVLPQIEGRGYLRLQTKTARAFFDAFLKHHATYFDKTARYQKIRKFSGLREEVEGTNVDLSEIWWHFRWWWVDRVRAQLPEEEMEKFFRRIKKGYNEKLATNLKSSKAIDLLPEFDDFLENSKHVERQFSVIDPLSEFLEWSEEYNTSEGIRDAGDYVSSLFHSEPNGFSEYDNNNWHVVSYVVNDYRDNYLLNRHFSLSDSSKIPVFIEPQMLFVFSMRPSGDQARDEETFIQLEQIADHNIGKVSRVPLSRTKQVVLA